VLGMGGICSGADALQFLAAGASAVSVGTTVFGDPGALQRITDELEVELERLGYSSVSEVVGVAHRPGHEASAREHKEEARL